MMFFSMFNILYLFALGAVCLAEKITYISTEHPKITYLNPKYVAYSNVTSHRKARNDPFYYVEYHFTLVWPISNNVSVDIIFYESINNRYIRSFVEMHFLFCDLVHNDTFIGAALKQGRLAQPCPYPAGDYHLYNMTIQLKNIPQHFPFSKGRLFANLTSTGSREILGTGHIDMEVKSVNIRKRNPNN